MDSDDAGYLNQLKNQEWFTFTGYLDAEKVKANIPSFHYLLDQINKLEDYCTEKVFNHVMSKENLLKSQNAKELGRHGVPPKYMREFLLKLCFTKEVSKESYTYHLSNSLHNFRVEDLGDYIPYLTGKKTLEESLPIHYLNNEGILVLKEILWMLQTDNTYLEFSPYIIGILSFLLIFLKKEEALKVMRALIKGNYSYTETASIRFHFRFNFDDNTKIVSSVAETMTEISTKTGKSLNDHFKQINFATELLYEDIIFNFMLKHLNFFGMIKFLPFFLLEGTKSMYRLIYALVKTTKDDLLKINNADNVLDESAKIMRKIQDYDSLFDMGYGFGLNRYNNKYEFQKDPEFDSTKAQKFNYYIPKFTKRSEILKDKDIIKLWSEFPSELRMKDAKKVYSSSIKGYSLNNVISLKEDCSESNCLMVIMETQENEVFGFVVSGVIDLTEGKFKRPLISLLLNKEEEMKIYKPNPDSDDIIFVDKECLMFGNGPNGPAMRIDKDFNIGYSNKGNCFDCPVLSKKENGQFEIKKYEIFELVI